MTPDLLTGFRRGGFVAALVIALLLAVLVIAPASEAFQQNQPAAACTLDVVPETDLSVVGESTTFTVSVDCVCDPLPNFDTTVECDFLLFELNAVDSGGLFEPLQLPVGPPGPSTVTLVGAQPGSGEVSFRWYGELASPAPDGGVLYRWAYLSATTEVSVQPDLPGPAYVLLVNANESDMFIPPFGETRSPTFRELTGGAGGRVAARSDSSPIPVNRYDTYVIDLILAAGEELDELTCTTGVLLRPGFEESTMSNSVRIEGAPLDGIDESVCTFTTTQGVFGDVNCDGRVSILDAVIIAEYSVGLRGNESCPTSPGEGQVTLATADTNDDQRVNILDAYRVAECTVGKPNSLCPAAGNN